MRAPSAPSIAVVAPLALSFAVGAALSLVARAAAADDPPSPSSAPPATSEPPAPSAPPSAATDEKDACASASEQAQVLRGQGKLVEAREQLLVCARSVCPAVVKQDCDAWISAVEAALPTIVPAARDDAGRDLVDVRVSVDGRVLTEHLSGLSVPIDPGVHVLRFEAPPRAPVEQQIVVREGEHDRAVAVVFAGESGGPPRSQGDAARPIPPLVYVGGTLAAVALGAFVFFEVDAATDAAHLRATCAPLCAQRDVDAVSNETVAANVALGASAVFAAATAAVWYVDRRSARAAAAPPSAASVALSVSVSIAPGRVVLRGAF